MKKLFIIFSLFFMFSACLKNIKEYPQVLAPVTYEMNKTYDEHLSKNWVTKTPYENEVFTTDYFEVVVFNAERGVLIMTEYHISKNNKFYYKNISQKFSISFYNQFDELLDTKILIASFDEDTIKRVSSFFPDNYYTFYQVKKVYVTQLKSYWR